MLRLFKQCDRGMAGMVYPDGGAVLDQPLVLLQAFAEIGHAYHLGRKAQRDGGNA